MTWRNPKLKQVKLDQIFNVDFDLLSCVRKEKLIYHYFPDKFDEKEHSKEETSNQCKYCKYSGKYLMMHLSMSKRCKEKYDMEESQAEAGKI